MTPVVLDASAAVALLLAAGGPGDWVGGQLSGRHVAAPELLMYETANVLRRHGARGAISPGEASLAHADLCALGVELWPYSIVSARVWELRDNLTAYDASYVAVAERLGAELITLDARLASATGPRCPVLTPPGTGAVTV